MDKLKSLKTTFNTAMLAYANWYETKLRDSTILDEADFKTLSKLCPSKVDPYLFEVAAQLKAYLGLKSEDYKFLFEEDFYDWDSIYKDRSKKLYLTSNNLGPFEELDDATVCRYKKFLRFPYTDYTNFDRDIPFFTASIEQFREGATAQFHDDVIIPFCLSYAKRRGWIALYRGDFSGLSDDWINSNLTIITNLGSAVDLSLSASPKFDAVVVATLILAGATVIDRSFLGAYNILRSLGIKTQVANQAGKLEVYKGKVCRLPLAFHEHIYGVRHTDKRLNVVPDPLLLTCFADEKMDIRVIKDVLQTVYNYENRRDRVQKFFRKH